MQKGWGCSHGVHLISTVHLVAVHALHSGQALPCSDTTLVKQAAEAAPAQHVCQWHSRSLYAKLSWVSIL